VPLYRLTQHLMLGRWLKNSLLPPTYRAQILALDVPPVLRA
jgi:hypothetical protein